MALSGYTVVPIVVRYASGTLNNSMLASLLQQHSIVPSRITSRFRMVSSILAPEHISMLSDLPEVERIYIDKMNKIPEMPPDIAAIASKTGDFGILAGRTRASSRISTLTSSTVFTTNDAKKLLGADVADQAGFTGQGVTVGIIDTGFSPRYLTHPQIRRRVTYKFPEGIPEDTSGHCTWLMSAIFGNKYTIPLGANGLVVEGISPGVTPVVGKGLFTPVGMGSDSAIIRAIDDVLNYKPSVINMSLGGKGSPSATPPDPSTDALLGVVEQLPDSVIACIAAGNDGSQYLNSPAIAENAIAVGAIDPTTGLRATFSNQGPDFVAPGVGVLSGVQSGTLMDLAGHAIPGFAILDGTSMATPILAGMVAKAVQLAQSKGMTLAWQDIINIGKMYGSAKTSDLGYGLLTWDMIQKYFSS